MFDTTALTQQPGKATPPSPSPAAHARPDSTHQSAREPGLSPAAAGPPLKKASVMPPIAPFSSGCGRQSVCEKYCCEHWVLSLNAHTANRCYNETNKTQTYSKKRALFLFPLPPARWPAALNNSTPRHTGRGLIGHLRSVKLGSGKS